MAEKMGKKMIALCSAAVGTIYLSGLLVTQPTGALENAHQAMASTFSALPSSSPAPSLSPSPHPENRGNPRDRRRDQGRMPSVQPSPTPAPSGSQANPPGGLAAGHYKDGKYTGSGTNRIGTVEVAVTLKSDKIVKVEITNCDTHYPERLIEALPAQVVERQSEAVDFVSRATLSSRDFQNAVREALDKAAQASKA
jgi:uncharacterized protein with FMN-binding domain